MINLASIDLSALPSVALEQRSRLPELPAIYFAIDSLGAVQYIGRSVNPRARWFGHHQIPALSAIQGVRIAWMTISDSSLLFAVESALIHHFQPPLNKTQIKVNSFGKGMFALRLRSGKRAEDIASELGVAMSTVRNWEQLRNVPRMTPLGMQKLMSVYKCTFDDLVQAELEAGQKEVAE